MKRRLFNLAVAVSLLLCIATVVLWVRSYGKLDSVRNRDIINFTREDPLNWLLTRRGQAVFYRQAGKNWDETPLAELKWLGIRFGGTRG
jgi:hypothetical protein